MNDCVEKICRSDAKGSVMATLDTTRRDAPYDTSTPASVVFTPYGYTPMAPSPLRTTRFVQNAPVGYGLATKPHSRVGGSGWITGRNVVVRSNASSRATRGPRDTAYVSRNVSDAMTIPTTAMSFVFFLPPASSSDTVGASSGRPSTSDGVEDDDDDDDDDDDEDDDVGPNSTLLLPSIGV